MNVSIEPKRTDATGLNMNNSARNVRLVKSLLLLILLFCNVSQALTLTIDDSFERQALGNGLQYLVEPNSNRPMSDILHHKDWQTANSEQLSFGFTDNAYWLKFRLHNTSNRKQQLVLEVANSYLDYIQVFLINSAGDILEQQTLGDQVPANQRSIEHAHFLHGFGLNAGQTYTLLMRVQTSSSLSIPLNIWHSNAFIEHDYRRSVLLAVFLGLLLMVSLYHYVLAILIRDITLFYYGSFVISLLVVFALREGLPALTLWPNSPLASELGNLFALSAASASACLFTTRILILDQAMPKLDKLFKLLALLAILPSIAGFVAPYGQVIRIALIYSLLILAIYGVALFQRIVDRYPPARHLIVASLFAAVGVITVVLTTVGILPIDKFTQTAIYGGFAMMALFFSLSISYRINMDRMLREEAQRKLTHELDELVRERTEELESVNKQLHVVSVTDGLTQLYNRRHFDHTLKTEYNRAFRENSTLAILLLDIDHFKALNDKFGHQFGDLCLQTAAHILQQSVHRPTDMVARYGGEEFVILLPETDLLGAIHIARNINEAIAKQQVTDGETQTHMTVSIGVACEQPEQKDQHEQLLKRADQWLYKAKENGRNRVEGDS